MCDECWIRQLILQTCFQKNPQNFSISSYSKKTNTISMSTNLQCCNDTDFLMMQIKSFVEMHCMKTLKLISGSFSWVRVGLSSLALASLVCCSEESAESENKALGLSANLRSDPHLWSRAKTHDPMNKFTDTSTGVSFLCWVTGLSLRQGEKLGHPRGAMGWAALHPRERGASWGGSGVWSGRLPGEVS